MQLSAYPAYKPADASGVSRVPVHWKVKRLRCVAHTNPSRHEIRLDETAEVSFVPMDNVGERGGIRIDVQRPLDEIDAGYTYFAEGDVVVAKITPSFENGKGALATGLVNGVAFGTTELHVIRPGDEIDRRFLFYVTIADHFRKIGESEMYGAGGQKRIPDTFIRDFRIALPPIPEQQGIANALDQETSRIDELIQKKRRMLELLEEKRLSVITRAVTQGLAEAQSKAAADYWLSNIPAHWQLTRIANLTTKITNGYVGPTRDILLDDGIRYIQSLHIKNGNIYFDRGHYYVSEEWSLAHSKSILRTDDVLVVQTGAEVGQTALVGQEHEGCNCHALIIMTPRSEIIRGAFLELYLRSDIGQKYLQSIQTGALHPHLNCTIIRDLRVPHPPTLGEQDELIERTKGNTYRIDRTIKEIEKALERFSEYRSALITNAVTGKIDVRGLAEKEAAA